MSPEFIRECIAYSRDQVTRQNFDGRAGTMVHGLCNVMQRMLNLIERDTTSGVGQIAAERRRHIEGEGWTSAHDDEHADGDLAAASSCYAYVA
jgi:hypothetical protein